MANLGEKGKFREKWRVCQKFIKGLAKCSNEIAKRGILRNGDFTKMTNFGKKLFKVWQKLKQDDKRGMHVDNCGLYENDSWRFSQKWQI